MENEERLLGLLERLVVAGEQQVAIADMAALARSEEAMKQAELLKQAIWGLHRVIALAEELLLIRSAQRLATVSLLPAEEHGGHGAGPGAE